METIYLSVDGAVRTLAEAVGRARRVKGRRCIVVSGGVYLDTAVTLTAEDSGLVIRAAEGEAPEFYGGLRVPAWRPEGEGSPFWVASLMSLDGDGDVAATMIKDFRMLVVNGRFARRARFPEEGGIVHGSRFPGNWMSTTKGGWDRKPTEEELVTMRVLPGTLPPAMSIRNAEVTVYHAWDESQVGVADWDMESGVMRFSSPMGHPAGSFWYEKSKTFTVFNVREGMTRPGQWYHDRERECVVYWPLEGESCESAVAYFPVHESVISVKGTAESPVRDLTLEGITLGVTTTPLVAGGFGAAAFAGGLDVCHCEGLSVRQCRVRWTGGQGIRIWDSRAINLEGVGMHDLGACGCQAMRSDCGTMAGCVIHDIGKTYPSAIGMHLSGNHWHVHHNTCWHTPYTAFAGNGTELRYEGNRFHHVMEELSDGAAIYVFGGKRCVMRGNVIEYVRPGPCCIGYYYDEQCEESLMEGNVATGVEWPLHLHMASRCTVRGNVFLSDEAVRITFMNCAGTVLEGNVIAGKKGFGGEASFAGIALLKNNVFSWGTGPYRWDFHDRTPQLEAHARPVPVFPQVEGSVLWDVGAVYEKGRISYRDEAMAEAMGLPLLDVSGAGAKG